MANETTLSTAFKALAIPELLELMLLDLLMQDLFVATRVNRDFRDGIKGSKNIQAAMRLSFPTRKGETTDHFAALYAQGLALGCIEFRGCDLDDFDLVDLPLTPAACEQICSSLLQALSEIEGHPIDADIVSRLRAHTLGPQLSLSPVRFISITLSNDSQSLVINPSLRLDMANAKSVPSITGAKKQHFRGPLGLSSWTGVKIASAPVAVRVNIGLGTRATRDETVWKAWGEEEADLGQIVDFLEDSLEDYRRRFGDPDVYEWEMESESEAESEPEPESYSK